MQQMRDSFEDVQRKKMLLGIQSMIEDHQMYHTVQTVIQKKNLPEKEKNRQLSVVKLSLRNS